MMLSTGSSFSSSKFGGYHETARTPTIKQILDLPFQIILKLNATLSEKTSHNASEHAIFNFPFKINALSEN